MKKLIPLILCMMMLSCKQETIPVVTATVLPAELAYLGPDTLFDTIPYQIIDIIRDTITPDSIRIDTLTIDTFTLDTFYLDWVTLYGVLSYEGSEPFGPALHEYGFCVDDSIWLPLDETVDQRTPAYVYDTFAYVLPVRNTDVFYVYTYAVNPFGFIRSSSRRVIVADFDPR